jgi:hypothetical protein
MTAPLATPRVRLPRQVRAGEAFEVRCLIEHPMVTGLPVEGARPQPRNMLQRLTVRVDGAVALDATLRNGTATNPYHQFFLRLERSAEVEFTWTDEQGRTARTAQRVTVA